MNRCRRLDLLLLSALVIAVALRLYQISDQIIADDEWHGLQTAVFGTYGWVLSHFGSNDYCIPLTTYYKLLIDTVGLSELGMRAPVLFFGTASVLAFPLLLPDTVGRRIRNLYAWLLATAPLHVYYSRYARPYAITLFFTFVGILAFFRWLKTRDRRWVIAYASSAIIGPYFHLVVLPALLAPPLFGLLEPYVARYPHDRLGIRDLAPWAAVVSIALILLLAPPLLSDLRSLRAKLTTQAITLDAGWGAIQLLTGTSGTWLTVLTVSVVTLGATTLIRADRRFFYYLLFASLLPLACSALAHPAYIGLPIVLVRYNLLLLPILLLFAASGLTTLDEMIMGTLGLAPRGLTAALVCGLLFWLGPLPTTYYWPNNWTNHALFQYAYDETSPYSYTSILAPRKISAFYDALGRLPAGSIRIIEAPWYYQWHRNPYPLYQRRHRQWMAIGFLGEALAHAKRDAELPLPKRGLSFRNFVSVVDAFERLHVRYMVVHKNLNEEIPSTAPSTTIDVSSFVKRCRGSYGEAIYEDESIMVFDVAAANTSRPSNRRGETLVGEEGPAIEKPPASEPRAARSRTTPLEFQSGAPQVLLGILGGDSKPDQGTPP